MELSIIVPTYNRNHSVLECILALDHHGAEIIVIDDGSAEPVHPPANIRILRHESNKGRAAALNTGLQAATHNLVLIVNDDIFASPEMVTRLVDEFTIRRNPRLAVVGRVIWDPDIPLTLTMRWAEEMGQFRRISSDQSGPIPNLMTGNTLMWRPFIVQHGGFDENFTRGYLEDLELGLRLKPHGLETRLLASAVGYHHGCMRVRDLVHRKQQEGVSAVYLHSKYPDHVREAGDLAGLLQNETQMKDAEEIVEKLNQLEQSGCNNLTEESAEFYALLESHHFMRGILEGLREMGAAPPLRRSISTLAIYSQAEHLEISNELDEARRLFNLVLNRPDQEYWSNAEFHLGCIEVQLGHPNDALKHFTECLRLNPNHKKAYAALSKPPFNAKRRESRVAGSEN